MSPRAAGTSDSTTRAPSRSRSATQASAASLDSVSRPSPISGARRRSPTVSPSSRGSGTARPDSTDQSRATSSTLRAHRPDRVERRDEREDAVDRQVAPARLQAHRPARGRRQPDRAAGVRAETEVDEPGGERRRVPGRRAAGRLPGMERVVDGAVPRVDAEHAPGELGQVGLADDDRTGVERSLDDGRVGGRDVVAVDARAVGRADPGRVDQVLDEQRAPGERPFGGAEQRLVEPGDRGVVRVGEARLQPVVRVPRSCRHQRHALDLDLRARESRARRSRRASRPAASPRTPPGAPG